MKKLLKMLIGTVLAFGLLLGATACDNQSDGGGVVPPINNEQGGGNTENGGSGNEDGGNTESGGSGNEGGGNTESGGSGNEGGGNSARSGGSARTYLRRYSQKHSLTERSCRRQSDNESAPLR